MQKAFLYGVYIQPVFCMVEVTDCVLQWECTVCVSLMVEIYRLYFIGWRYKEHVPLMVEI
jgi:hypothetical protein